MNLTKTQLILLYVFASILFAFGMFVLIKDVHLIGAHSNWNRGIGSASLFFSLTMMFPVQIAYVLKLVKETAPMLWGFRKGEVPPPTPDIKPGTPITDEQKIDDSNLKG
jgi:hypothetical protein